MLEELKASEIADADLRMYVESHTYLDSKDLVSSAAVYQNVHNKQISRSLMQSTNACNEQGIFMGFAWHTQAEQNCYEPHHSHEAKTCRPFNIICFLKHSTTSTKTGKHVKSTSDQHRCEIIHLFLF